MHPQCADPDGVYGATLGAALRDVGIKQARDANPGGHAAAVRIIHDTAQRLEKLSANDVRQAMDTAGIPRTVAGGAWRSAVADGYIRAIGMKSSDDPATHAHKIGEYRSLVYRKVA